MKTKLLILLLLLLNAPSRENEDIRSGYDKLANVESLEIEKNSYKLKIEPLIQAMILIESEGNDSAYCKNEEAVGCLQIRPIMLAECNRILELQKSSKRYSLLDRWSRKKSIEIFHIINQYHNKEATYEQIARFWNGGPKWVEKSGTKRYWGKVRRKLKKLSKNNEKHSSDWLTQI
jgi:hypothetical protein